MDKKEEKLLKLEPGKFYWVKCFPTDEWEVAAYREDLTFRFCSGGRKEAKYVYEFKEEPIQPPL